MMLEADCGERDGCCCCLKRSRMMVKEGWIEVVRRRSYLGIEEVWDWVLSKEDSNLEEGAGTICGFNPP